MNPLCPVSVTIGDEIGRYHFGEEHPFAPGRMEAFWQEVNRMNLHHDLTILKPVMADMAAVELFHTREYVERVKAQCEKGIGTLDGGDTPALPHIYQAAMWVAGSVVDAVDRIMSGEIRRAFVPIAGLHHAKRDHASGFCVFNDCGIAIETLIHRYRLDHILYVDIDAHHGDGVYYGFEEIPHLYFADIHEDGAYVFPGTGDPYEKGKGAGRGKKLNIPLLPGATDKDFRVAWDMVEQLIDRARPEFIIFQCGADSMANDPLTHLSWTASAYAYAATRLCLFAEDFAEGRILCLGGGGYNQENVAKAWSSVLEILIDAPYGRTSSLLA